MRLILGFLAAASAIALAMPAQAEEIPHRDDFVMSSIGGGDFRGYILDHIAEDDALYRPMRTFGTVHNVMHQMMTELAIYAREVRDDPHVPDVADRVSGGFWTDYRKALEGAGEAGPWMDLAHVLEVMHDRVHHPMYKSVVYDHQSMRRDADLTDYVREPEDASKDRLIPDRDAIEAAQMGLEAFRSLIWEHEPEERHWRAVVQNAVVFAHLEAQLSRQWLQYAADHKTGACRPDVVGHASDEDWAGYVDRIAGCDDEAWRDLVQTHDLAQLRIHQALDHLARHHEGA